MQSTGLGPIEGKEGGGIKEKLLIFAIPSRIQNVHLRNTLR